MMVNEIESALTIYRDILGMQVHYDEEIIVSGQGLPAGEPDSKTRLVLLKCKDEFIGMLGILQYIDPPLPTAPPRPNPNRVQVGESVYVLHHDDVEAVYPQLKEVPGIEMVSDPHISEYPKPDGGVFRVLGSSFFDPNGYFVELNQFV
tara:strand:+ start:1335 stop:1778 length:444 start_codon:yes stop_codon:yes gene_type:complete